MNIRKVVLRVALAVGCGALVAGSMTSQVQVATSRLGPIYALAAAGSSEGTNGSSAAGAGKAFSISGNVGGLYPGLHTDLVLTISNPQHFTIAVRQITIAVTQAPPGCPATNLTLGGFSGALNVPARSQRQQLIPVTMAFAAPDPCQGALFQLEYHASATGP
jgi:hypothetical protein